MIAETFLLVVGFVLGVVVLTILGLTVLQGTALMTLAAVVVSGFDYLRRQGEQG